MIIAIAFLAMIGIAGAAVLVGLREEKQKGRAQSPQGRSNREKLNMLRVSGGMPNRKEG